MGVERCREALLLLLFLPVGQLNSFGLAEMLVVSSYLMVGAGFLNFHRISLHHNRTESHSTASVGEISEAEQASTSDLGAKQKEGFEFQSTATSGTRPTRPTLTSATRTFNKFSEFLSHVAPKRDPRKMAIDRAQKGTATKKTGWMGNKMQLFCD